MAASRKKEKGKSLDDLIKQELRIIFDTHRTPGGVANVEDIAERYRSNIIEYLRKQGKTSETLDFSAKFPRRVYMGLKMAGGTSG